MTTRTKNAVKAGRCRCRRALAGVTLIELMVAITLVTILTVAVTRAFIGGIDMERAYARREQQTVQFDQIEQHITDELHAAFLSETTTDATTYFVGEDGNAGTSSGNGGTTTQQPGAIAASNSASGGGSTTSSNSQLGCDRLTFTTIFPDVPLLSQTSTDDFETQQQEYGPVGGPVEVSISTTAVGNPTAGQTGLFERIQRPSDADATQGGTESLLSPDVASIGFQFWDGTQWLTSWDTTSTTTGQSRRLPAAVLVSYTLVSDPSQTTRSFVVAIPQSNVTANNPITATTTPGAGG